MVNTRLFLLNSKQMAELVHDHVAENGATWCYDNSLNDMSTYIIMDKNDVRMLCAFSKNNSLIVNQNELINRLPYSGMHNFVLTNNQIKEIIENNKVLCFDDIKLDSEEKHAKINKKSMRFMILNENEIKWILFKQLIEFIDYRFGIESNSLKVGLQVKFNGDDSRALFYFGSCNDEFDFEKIDDLPYNMLDCWDIKYIDLNENEIKSYLK